MKQTFGRTLTRGCPKKEQGSAGSVVLWGRGKMFDQFATKLTELKEKEPCMSLTLSKGDKWR